MRALVVNIVNRLLRGSHLRVVVIDPHYTSLPPGSRHRNAQLIAFPRAERQWR